MKKGSPEGYNAETGLREPAQKPLTGEAQQRQPLYRIRCAQENYSSWSIWCGKALQRPWGLLIWLKRRRSHKLRTGELSALGTPSCANDTGRLSEQKRYCGRDHPENLPPA